MKHATGSCAFNREINCHCGQWVIKQPAAKELHCAKCGWNPDVEKARREEVKQKYGTKLQSPVHGGHEV